MKVIMRNSETGRLEPNGPVQHFRAGTVYEVPEAIAKAWLKIGLAAPVRPQPLASPRSRKGGKE